ncbi:MAG: hypothetical protein K8H88_09855, partial [Sandaracinaceae bacterium]|nr:hypothetical protein [Sandaracinaceae bacterium]
EGSPLKYAIFVAFFVAPIVLIGVASHVRDRGGDIVVPGLVMLMSPLTAAGLGAVRLPGLLNAAQLPGYLPKILLSVVLAVVVFLALALALRRAPVLLLAVVQLFIAGATVVSYVWQDEIPYAFAQLVVSIPEAELADHVGTVQFFTFLTAMLCTLPATLGMGAMFPLTMRVWTSGGDRIARDVAVVYTGNTIGSIVGSWLPGFVLFMWIGAERTLHVGIFLNTLLALVMLIAGAADSDETAAVKGAKATADRKKPDGLPLWHAVSVYIMSPLIPALLALLYLGTKDPDSALRWNLTRMTLGVFRLSLAEGMLDEQAWGTPDLVYYRDGLTTTVSVERWGRHLALKNNGKVDASNGDDMPTQINVATYPLLLHSRGPENLDVAIVGFGSGVTVGTTLGFPVRRVDVIELERSIPEAARHFEEYNRLQYRLAEWPYVQQDRLQIINDDGRNFLASTRQQYDVIISEPSNPWITGVSDLFTVDHWRITKQRLRPGGIYCQWVQLYELSPENIKIIYRTFASQFEHVLVLSADDRSSDTVMLGSDRPIRLDLERAQRTYHLPGVADALERANVYSPFDIFARTLFTSREEIMRYTQIESRERGGAWERDVRSTNGTPCEAPSCRREAVVLNTDDNAHIEFAAPRDLIGFARYQDYLSTIYSETWPFGHARQALAGFGQGDGAARNYAELAMSLIAHGRYGWAGDFIELSQQTGRARETAVALEVLTRLLTSDNEPGIEIEPPMPGPEMDADTARQLQEGFDNVRDSVDEHAYGAALVAMESIPAPLRLHSGPAMRFLYGFLLYKAADGQYSQYHAAVEQLEGLLHGDEDYVVRHPEVYYFLAKAHNEEGNYSDALRAMRAYVEARLVPLDRDEEEVPEPPPAAPPASDAPGEAPKDTHDAHG